MKTNKTGARLAALLLATLAFIYGGLCNASLSADAAPFDIIPKTTVYLGGAPFGVKLHTKGAIVIGTDDIESFGGTVSPAEECGIKKGDIITEIDGKPFVGADALKAAVEESNGNGVVLTVERNGASLSITLYPALCKKSNRYRAGLWLRDSTAGIGTVTYTCSDGSFAGLGHGIVDAESGILMPINDAAVVDVEITGARKGTRGAPGELKGTFGNVKRGALTANTTTGVYGTLEGARGEPIAVANSTETRTGKAYIYSTLDGSEPSRYEISIEKISHEGNTKNMVIRVTDKKLLEKTGGIVQGMSVCYNKTNTKKTA